MDVLLVRSCHVRLPNGHSLIAGFDRANNLRIKILKPITPGDILLGKMIGVGGKQHAPPAIVTEQDGMMVTEFGFSSHTASALQYALSKLASGAPGHSEYVMPLFMLEAEAPLTGTGG